MSLALTGGFFTTGATWKAPKWEISWNQSWVPRPWCYQPSPVLLWNHLTDFPFPSLDTVYLQKTRVELGDGVSLAYFLSWRKIQRQSQQAFLWEFGSTDFTCLGQWASQLLQGCLGRASLVVCLQKTLRYAMLWENWMILYLHFDDHLKMILIPVIHPNS